MRCCLRYVALQELIHDGGECSTNKRANDEDPQAYQWLEVASKAGDDRGTKAACGVDGRTGEADAQNVHEGEGETNYEASKRAMLKIGGGDAQDSHHEDEGQDDLYQQTRDGTAIDTGESVGAKATGEISDAAERKDAEQEQRSREGTHELSHDVAHKVICVHAAGEQYGKRDGRVHMAARHVANAVGHSDDGEAKRQSGEQITATVCSVTTNEHGSTTAHKHQYERTNAFRDIPLHGSFLS